MLEKIFGKRSTGIFFLVCTTMLLLAYAGALLTYLFWNRGSLLSLIGFTLYTAFELALIVLPVFVQKKFRLYIPPSVEVCICLYSLLYLFGHSLYSTQNSPLFSLTAPVGGFTVAMTVFCILHTPVADRARKKGKKTPALLLSLFTFGISLLLILLYVLISWAFTPIFAGTPQEPPSVLLTYAGSHIGGAVAFCLIGWVSARSGKRRYAIYSFKDVESAERNALENNDKTQYTVIRNLSLDTTDYKKLLKNVKAKFLFGRILYLVLYAAYLVYAGFSYVQWGTLGIVILVSLLAGFVLISLVYVYEYRLFLRGSPNQRLRKLKIAKTCVRVYALLLILTVTYISDYKLNELSVLISDIMAVVNLCSLFYNLFGSPKNYPAASLKAKKLRRKTLPSQTQTSLAQTDADSAQADADSAQTETSTAQVDADSAQADADLVQTES